MYELFHKKAPFRGRSVEEVKKKIKLNQIVFKKDLDPEIRNWIIKMLNVYPKNRPHVKHILSDPYFSRFKNQMKIQENISKHLKNNSNFDGSEEKVQMVQRNKLNFSFKKKLGLDKNVISLANLNGTLSSQKNQSNSNIPLSFKNSSAKSESKKKIFRFETFEQKTSPIKSNKISSDTLNQIQPKNSNFSIHKEAQRKENLQDLMKRIQKVQKDNQQLLCNPSKSKDVVITTQTVKEYNSVKLPYNHTFKHNNKTTQPENANHGITRSKLYKGQKSQTIEKSNLLKHKLIKSAFQTSKTKKNLFKKKLNSNNGYDQTNFITPLKKKQKLFGDNRTFNSVSNSNNKAKRNLLKPSFSVQSSIPISRQKLHQKIQKNYPEQTNLIKENKQKLKYKLSPFNKNKVQHKRILLSNSSIKNASFASKSLRNQPMFLKHSLNTHQNSTLKQNNNNNITRFQSNSAIDYNRKNQSTNYNSFNSKFSKPTYSTKTIPKPLSLNQKIAKTGFKSSISTFNKTATINTNASNNHGGTALLKSNSPNRLKIHSLNVSNNQTPHVTTHIMNKSSNIQYYQPKIIKRNETKIMNSNNSISENQQSSHHIKTK